MEWGQQRQRLLWSSLESSEDPRTCAFVLCSPGNNGSGSVVDLNVAAFNGYHRHRHPKIVALLKVSIPSRDVVTGQS